MQDDLLLTNETLGCSYRAHNCDRGDDKINHKCDRGDNKKEHKCERVGNITKHTYDRGGDKHNRILN